MFFGEHIPSNRTFYCSTCFKMASNLVTPDLTLIIFAMSFVRLTPRDFSLIIFVASFVRQTQRYLRQRTTELATVAKQNHKIWSDVKTFYHYTHITRKSNKQSTFTYALINWEYSCEKNILISYKIAEIKAAEICCTEATQRWGVWRKKYVEGNSVKS